MNKKLCTAISVALTLVLLPTAMLSGCGRDTSADRTGRPGRNAPGHPRQAGRRAL